MSDLVKQLRGAYSTIFSRSLAKEAAEEIERLTVQIADSQALSERLKQEAQIHAQEAKTANSTIAEIYQLCTGASGEPGNWHGANPVREALAEAKRRHYEECAKICETQKVNIRSYFELNEGVDDCTKAIRAAAKGEL